MTDFDRIQIANRLRGLLGTHARGDLTGSAAALGVDERSLRMSVDEHSPRPTLDVIRAVVREYGVDPGWLLTGEYQSSSHRAAIEGGDLTAAVRAFQSHRRSSISEPTPEHFRALTSN